MSAAAATGAAKMGSAAPAGLILTLNAGSSSLKASIWALDRSSVLGAALAVCQVEPLGEAARLIWREGGARSESAIGAADHSRAVAAILRRGEALLEAAPLRAVGHRIAHGGAEFAEPRELDAAAMAALVELAPFAPLHQPHNLAAARAAMEAFPAARQIGCFDTAFHRGHPFVNDVFALPRRYYEAGVRRYGFHGLSYQYVTRALAERAPSLAAGRVIVAHLGAGASMCAVKAGRSIASTMGFSALDGLPMATRCGQLDPGALLYVMERDGLSPAQISAMLYKESGLKGLSGISGDLRVLEASSAPEAAQAIDYYIFRIRREIGAMAATLGGLDALVFCGGVGENSARIRAAVCADMDWLGLSLDPERNAAPGDAPRDIAADGAATSVQIIPTDEERVIAEAAATA
ncbi:MAG: acetate/propionate family kinase [Pseudomonadota bacterium]